MNIAWVPKPEIDRLLAVSSDPFQRAALLASACRINTLAAIMRAGSGHIGSSFSAMDIVVWLHLEALTGNAVYFSSKGHDAPGLYAVMTALGRLPFEKLHELRRLGGLPGHPDVGTPGIPTNTGSLGMGISKAKGMIHAARLDGIRRPVFVLTGDGELQEGQIWESLQGAATRGLGELTVIVDHNKIQSDTWVEKVAPLGDLEAKFRSFGWDVARVDGHDLPRIQTALDGFARNPDRPHVLIADTIKGRGVSFMEKTSAAGEFEFYKFHSGAPTVDHFEAALVELEASANELLAACSAAPLQMERDSVADRTPPAGQRVVPSYGRALVEAARRRPELVVLDADLMLDCGLIPFAEEFPDRFFECGIAEQDMVSQAGGLALSDKLPVVHSFACFLTPRANEQIYNNATEHTKIIYAGSLAGLVPGGPGHSHQSVRDIALLAQIPGLTLIEPSCETEAAAALDWAVDQNPQSTYIRLTSIPVDIPFELPASYQLEPGRGCVLREGTDAAIIAYGPVLLTEAWHAAGALAEQGVSVRLINLPWLNRVDADWLAAALAGVSKVVSLDNHYTVGGQGDRIAAAQLPVSLTTRGLSDIPACGANPDVLRAHGLDRDSIAALFT